MRKRQGRIEAARLYHAHHSLHMEDLTFWLELASRQGDPVLELGCGTGRLLLPLAQAGRQVFGLDRDASMLAVLQENLRSANMPHAEVFQADAGAFHLGAAFRLILLPCNTLSTLPPATRRAMLSRAAQHLAPGGLFAASLPNPGLFSHLPARSAAQVEEVFPHPRDGRPVQVSSGWRRSAGYFTIDWVYDHLQADGTIRRMRARAPHRLDPAERYQHEIERAGLEVIDQYGDFNGRPFQKRSPFLILIAKRK